MKDVKKQSSYKVLLLLGMLFDGEYNRNEIIEEFHKNNIEIKKTSVINYINKLKDNNIPVVIRKVKNINYYSIDKNITISPKFLELSALSDVKKILVSDKNLAIIKNAIKVFYRLALRVNDSSTKFELMNFDYYSKINWVLVKELEKHCKSKDIIIIDYITPDGQIKPLEVHADMVQIGDMSDRLYLYCILKGDNKLSQLPADKIFTIKKVVKKHVKMNLKTKILTYKISENMLKRIGLSSKERLLEVKDNIATIECPISDDFFTVQHLMRFCPELYYISDDKLKNLIKEKLYTLKDMYNEQNK